MKNSLIYRHCLCFLTTTFCAGITKVSEQFQKIGTVPQADQFIAANAALKPALLHLSYDKDSSLIDKRLLRQNKGDIFSVGYVTYKVLEVNHEDACLIVGELYLPGWILLILVTDRQSPETASTQKLSEGDLPSISFPINTADGWRKYYSWRYRLVSSGTGDAQRIPGRRQGRKNRRCLLRGCNRSGGNGIISSKRPMTTRIRKK